MGVNEKMTINTPELITSRLVLRLLDVSDSSRIAELAGHISVYETTLNIPYPYMEDMAEKWILTSLDQFNSGKCIDFAITLKESGDLIGAIGLVLDSRHKRAEMGYWIGVPYWNHGYCSEAASTIITYGFKTLKYHKIASQYMVNNPASGRVMEKSGMTFEGELRDEVYKDGRYHTLKIYGILNNGK
jgi:[ribosomal protein S5]-alanine N-acetyltransferase